MTRGPRPAGSVLDAARMFSIGAGSRQNIVDRPIAKAKAEVGGPCFCHAWQGGHGRPDGRR